MKKNISTFSRYIKGNWLLQENFYIESSINIKTIKGRINFLKNHDDISITENGNKSQNFNYSDFSRKNNVLLKVKKTENNKLIVYVKNKSNKISYQEKLYNPSKNIMISLGVLKNIKRNTYIGIKISSYIRIL